MPRPIKSQEDEFYDRRTKNLSQEGEFYRDLDENTEEKSCCSAYTLAIFFILLFCFLSLLTIYVIKNAKIDNLPEVVPEISTALSGLDLSRKSPTIEVPISAADLTVWLQTGLSGLGANFSEPEAEIIASQILVTGKIQIAIKTGCTMTILPSVKDDKLYLTIIKLQSWKMSVPGIIRSGLEKSLNGIMDKNLESFYQSYKATDVQLEEDKMIIFGKLK